MGEVVNFKEWKQKLEDEETRMIQEDIENLHAEQKHMLSEIDSDDGPYMYEQEWLYQLPALLSISSTLDGYINWEYAHSCEGDDK